MKRSIGFTIVLTALATVSATDTAAQDQLAEGRRGLRGPAVEAIMQMRDRLELTEAQLAELETVRRASVQRRSTDMAEMYEMRSRFAAGQIQRSELMAFMEDRREANAGLGEQRRDRLAGILNEEQLQTVERLRGNARAFARGRAAGTRGARRDVRGQRGFRDGPRSFRGGQRGFRGTSPRFRDGRGSGPAD